MNAPSASGTGERSCTNRMTRTKAFLTHLLVSVTVVSALLGVLVTRWYPMPYFVADGGWQGLRLIVGIDIVLGPLLSFVVYSPAKTRRALLFDYAVIGLLQVSAFGFGVWTVFTQRTALVVFADGSFYTVPADEIALAGTRARTIAARASTTPAYAVVRMPEDPEARQELRRESLATMRPLFLRGDLMEPLGPATVPLLQEYAVDLSRAARGSPRLREVLDGFLARNGARETDFLFLPLVCKFRSLTIVLDPRTGGVRGFLPIGYGPGRTIAEDGGA